MQKVFEPTQFIISGMLPGKGCYLLSGKPKIGKTRLGLNVIVGISQGRLVLGKIAVPQMKTLFLCLEEDEEDLQEYTLAMTDGIGITNDLFQYEMEWPRMGQGGIEQLQKHLGDNPDIGVVLIDSLAAFGSLPSGKKSNKPLQDDYLEIKQLNDLANTSKKLILLIVHSRKMKGDDPLDDIAGTNGLMGGASGAWVLRAVRGSKEATLYVDGRKIKDSQDYALTRDN